MFRKYIAGILIPVFLLGQIFVPLTTHAVPTDGLATNWTYAKAEHLARRVLFYPTPAEVAELYNAGSAAAAVDILFPSEEGPDRTQYNNELTAFTTTQYSAYYGSGASFGWNTNNANMLRYALYRYTRDPYEAKAKMATIFEDIYSVNTIPGNIEYGDILALHKLLYTHTLGNYKTLVKRALLNNPTDKGDYAASEFLNLLRQYDYKNPNENYPREMLQLFLMGEYLPGDSKDNGDPRNYSEGDVASLAKIITGYWSDNDPNTTDDTSVYYRTEKHNTASGLVFLAGNTGGVNFPFYDSNDDTVDASGMQLPILGNNGLGDNTIDYIFAKRSHAVAMFLAEKFYKFYVDEKYTRTELESIAAQIEANNFELFPSIKWLLVQDFMYSDESMNSILYYNPLELVVGLFKLLHAQDPNTFDTNFLAYSDLLSRLGWIPFTPGSIFGRDGYDTNYKWFSAYTATQWTNLVTTITYDYTRTGAYLMSNIVPVTSSGSSDITMDDLITQVEDNLLLGRDIPVSLENQIKNFLTTSETGASIPFQPNVQSYRNLKFPGVFAIMLAQPEFILKSGYDQPTATNISEPSKIENASGALIVVELPGGYDWLNGIIPKNDYTNYQTARTNASGSSTIAQSLTGLVDIGDYYMNRYLAYSGGNIANGPALKQQLDNGNLKIFNRVGTSLHSRDHNQAQIQMVSINNSVAGGRGVLGVLSEFDATSTNTYVMGNKQPEILQGGNYMNLGVFDNRISHSNPKGALNTNQRNHFISTMMSTFTGRVFPGKVGDRYAESLDINNIANLSVSQGGSAGVGSNTAAQLKFTKTLLDNNEGKIYYIQNTGNGYDTHSNELSGSTNLDLGIGKAVADVSAFFEQIKGIHNVTIVMYSEFGRTIKMNGTDGTDHGEGGGMFVLSNNSDILSSLTGSIYGDINIGKERDNWLSPGIDYRSVYGRIIDKIYGIPEGTYFPNYTRTLEDDLSSERAVLPLLHTEFYSTSNSKLIPYIKFFVAGENYDFQKGSYVMSSYSTGSQYISDSSPFLLNGISNYARLTPADNGEYTFDPNGIYDFPESSTYSYVLNPITNQYRDNPYTGSLMLPEVLGTAVNTVATGSHSVMRRYHNTSITHSGYIPSGSGIILASDPTGMTDFAPQEGVSLRAYTGTTYITSLTSSGMTRMWNGGFIIGEKMTSSGFLPQNAYLIEDNLLLKDFVTSNTIRIGADVIGVGMQLSNPVEVTITGATANTDYYVFTSEDGIAWKRQSPTPYTSDASGNVVFDTDHFSLFTLAEIPSSPICDLQVDDTTVPDGTTVNLSWNTFHADTVTLSPSIGNVGLTGSIGIIPPANTSTTYTLEAVNGQGTGTCQVIVKSVTLPACTLSASASSVKNGSSVSLTWTGTHATTATLFPAGTTVPTSANINLVPPSSTTTNYTVTVTNDVASANCDTSVTTYANSAPVANTDSMSVLENHSSLFDVLTNDTDADGSDILTVASIISIPNHGTAQISGTGILFTGIGGYCGPDSFSYRAQDQDGAVSNTATVNVNISCGMNPPVTSDVTLTGNEDGTISGLLTGTDIDGDSLIFMSASGASHGMINLLSDGTLLYTPTANYHGSDSFEYYAYDGTQSGNISTVTLTVNPVNDLPVAYADSGMTNMNASTFIDVLANDIDIDHSPAALAINITTSPMSGALIHTGGMLEYTPNTGYCGTDTFAYRITDGSGGTSNIVSVNMDILCVNDAPVATPDTALGVEDTLLNIDFISNDTDPDFASGADSIVFHDFITLPAHGTVTVTTSGSATANRSNEIFTYTPTADSCGTDTFTYRVRDTSSAISSTAFVNITLTCTNDAPIVPNSIDRTGYSDVAYTGVLTATDIDNSDLTYHMVNPTSLIYGTASISSTGVYTYTPLQNSGSTVDNLYYTATDGSGAVSNTGVIIFSLTNAPVIYTYTGSAIVATGSAQIFSGMTLDLNKTLDLNGNSISATSHSGSTGSIILPGTLDILVESGMWSGEILAPSILSSSDPRNIALTDAGVSPVLPTNTSTMTYTYIPADTFKAGSEDAALALTGGYADIEFVVDTPGVVFGSRLQVFRSQDGITWESNYPDTSCIVDNELKCTFRTNHLTYFGTVQQISTPIVQAYVPTTGPGGYYSAPVSNPAIPGLILGGTGYTSTGGLLPGYSVKSQAYIDWVKKYQVRYAEKYVAEKVYWDILRKNDTVDERIKAVDTVVTDMMDADESLFDIALMIDTFWTEKLNWKYKRK